MLLLLITVSMAAITVGWLESLLSLYLTHQFSLSLSAVGLCFLLWSVVYTAGEDFSNLKLTSLSSSGSSLNSCKLGLLIKADEGQVMDKGRSNDGRVKFRNKCSLCCCIQ